MLAIQRRRQELESLINRAYAAAEGQGLVDARLSEFQRQLRRVLRNVERQLVDLAATLDIQDGRFLTNEENFARLSGVREQIVEAARPELLLAEEYVRGFDDLVGYVQRSFEIMRVPAEFTRLSVDVINELKADQFARFHEVSTTTREALRRGMYDAVLGGASFDDFSRNIAASLYQDVTEARITTRTGLVRRVNFEAQARTIAHDAITQHGAAVNEEAARTADIERFLYAGPLDGITRPFCRELITGTGVSGKRSVAPRIFTRAARAELDNGQTGAGSVPITRGGYNCRHRWLPLSDEMHQELMETAEVRGWDR